MRAKDNMRTAAEVLVDQLINNGVRHVFCVPGESYLAVLDAFHDRDITVTVCRQEGGAAMMAEATNDVYPHWIPQPLLPHGWPDLPIERHIRAASVSSSAVSFCRWLGPNACCIWFGS